MEKHISVIIPSYNRGTTIGKCLEAALSSQYNNYEVIVVDDCSTDNSADIIKNFPCRLIRLSKHSGASAARNAGVNDSNGEILFFIDSDCLLQKDTLSLVNETMTKFNGDRIVIGGSYTPVAFDDNFFSTFQSIFVNYFETKRVDPDYIAAHAMGISAQHFKDSGGFQEHFLPILEDVEFSHRLRRDGFRLLMSPRILVRHIFGFSLLKSLRNAFRKSMYWTAYSIQNKDLLADSGTASIELKINGVSFLLSIIVLLLSLISKTPALLTLLPLMLSISLYLNRRLLTAFFKARGSMFAVLATLYYITLYPAAIWSGVFAGIVKHLFDKRAQRKYA